MTNIKQPHLGHNDDILTLSRTDLAADPHQLFDQWMSDAQQAQIIDATAMTLATVDRNGQPHARIVLLKKFSNEGFVWFTHKHSAKAQQLAHTGKAALLFYWQALERQVRICGTVTEIVDTEASRYFYSRPEASRFSAVVSEQSTPVVNRRILEDKLQALQQKYPDGNIACPESWVGYRLKAESFEFWQGRPCRLHDRFHYSKEGINDWVSVRLCP